MYLRKFSRRLKAVLAPPGSLDIIYYTTDRGDISLLLLSAVSEYAKRNEIETCGKDNKRGSETASPTKIDRSQVEHAPKVNKPPDFFFVPISHLISISLQAVQSKKKCRKNNRGCEGYCAGLQGLKLVTPHNTRNKNLFMPAFQFSPLSL